MPLEEGQKFCRKCGAAVRGEKKPEEVKIEEAAEVTPVGVTETAQETPQEPKAESTAAVPVAPAADTPSPAPVKEEKKESKKIPVWVIVLLLAGALGLGALIGSSMGKNSSSSAPAAAAEDNAAQPVDENSELDDEEIVYTVFTDAGAGIADGQTVKPMEDVLVQDFVKDLDFSELPIGKVNVKTARIRFRKGPSTSSTDTKKRTAVGDVYDVYEKTTGEGYNWYRVSKDEWIADNNGKWMTFTAYNNGVDAMLDAQYAAEVWKGSYDSYLISINNDGDFHGYLSRCTTDLREEFEERYSLYHKGLEIENLSFEFDMTDYDIQDLGSNNFLLTCHAWVTNSLYSKDTGQRAEHSFGIRAVLAYSPGYEDLLVISQDFDPDYSTEGHSMLSIND